MNIDFETIEGQRKTLLFKLQLDDYFVNKLPDILKQLQMEGFDWSQALNQGQNNYSDRLTIKFNNVEFVKLNKKFSQFFKADETAKFTFARVYAGG